MVFVLDCWLLSTAWDGSSWTLSPLWSGRVSHWSPYADLHVCERVLVQSLAESPTPKASSTTGWELLYGVVAKDKWKSSRAIQKGSQLIDYFRSLDTLEASKLMRFYGIAPNLVAAVSQADEERRFWELAGARGNPHLIAAPRGLGD
jgi:hypothetical protein